MLSQVNFLFHEMQKDSRKALDFIKANLDFFCAPFLHQKEFQNWVMQAGQEKNVRSLTDSLFVPLTNPISHLGEFIDSLIGKALQPNDRACLLHGDEQRLINLLEKHRHLRRAILMIARNPSIQKWNEDHPQLIKRTQKFFSACGIIHSLEEKLKTLAPQFKEDAKYSLTCLSLLKEELHNWIDAQKGVTGEVQDFGITCTQLIQQARQDLIKRWGKHPQLKHLLFLMGKIASGCFTKENPYSFFHEQSLIIDSISQLETTFSPR
ncbi:hypothetical protein EAW55_09820 [Legionella jordanis]|uniref:Uncharacterized protein n=2 Tax=Legionella jordanis TaxID=456 RepID=A0A0W0VCB1_9GAMM|nr:hypothetical protein [Legionella jordanis]KTD17765.1 hypothetical protein Ljor_2071 [Legionella jordanis]RMX02529.1 hypothetical protein EAW55_09820 [Legionella jordanis]RMX21623.1 hypothetical protein EAS68_02375 [Legionella jordanis]VEH11299.1 Uncharacterised protein [Legionella jordanis]